MSLLKVENLTLGFNFEAGFRRALKNVYFSLEEGKIHALVGESGCGKTLSAMSILRLLPKTAIIETGQIIFEGRNLMRLSNKELQSLRGSKIALIPQDPMMALNPLYTIENQLLEIIKLHQGLKGKEALDKALEALDAVQIPSAKQRLKSYPHEFSGGMKQRAIIAMALACNANILIADEPTTALDVTVQAQIMQLLQEIKTERNTSILLITHDLGLVAENSDEVSVMYSGQIIEHAPTDEFFKNTNHPYSAALIRAIPTNKYLKLHTLEGQPPSIQQEISGCKFHPRCKFCISKLCDTTEPESKEIRPSHFSACHLN